MVRVVELLTQLVAVLGLSLGVLLLLVAILYMARVFRPKNLVKLVTADLPSITEFSATVKILGQSIVANAKMDEHRDQQFSAIDERISHIEAALATQSEVTQGIISVLSKPEAENA